MWLDFELPPERIAQYPAEPRDTARLMVVRRDQKRIEHYIVRDLPDLLKPGDLLVLNDSKVIPARLEGVRAATGGKWEALFLNEANGVWELMAQTRGYGQPGEIFRTHSGLALRLIDRTDDRHWLMVPEPPGDAPTLLERHGTVPLPHYIRQGRGQASDQTAYQTIYAQTPGSVAAPTAGLHFTQELLDRLAASGIARTTITLHVGLGTFATMKSTDPAEHVMHAERFTVAPEAAAAINAALATGRRVIAVGTTTTRVLESVAAGNRIEPGSGSTRLFIHPPFQFRILRGLLTNFHLPRTTLLLLVQAFAGSELVQQAYEEAIQNNYRFFSYGDAMLVI